MDGGERPGWRQFSDLRTTGKANKSSVSLGDYVTEITLRGLDGGTVLGFMAGLGVLEAVIATTSDPSEKLTLRWNILEGRHPCVHGVDDLGHLAERILRDAHSEDVDRVLRFKYLKAEKNGLKTVSALGAPVAVYREAVGRALADHLPRTAALLGCLMSECSGDEAGEDGPSTADLLGAGIAFDSGVSLNRVVGVTPFDFTSRNVQFLDQIRRVRDVLSIEVILNEIDCGLGTSAERIMRWHSLVDMPGALFSRVSPTPHPVAEWLMFRAISFFPALLIKRATTMPGFTGRRKSGEFAWVLWEQHLRRDVIASVLSVRWGSVGKQRREALGAPMGFVASFRKDATGYDGAVSPSRPLE